LQEPTNIEPELFRVEINEEGKSWIQRFYNLAKLILVVAVLANLLSLALTLPYVLQANDNPEMPANMWIRNLLFIAHLIFTFVIQTAQVVYYKRFGQKITKALDVGDSVSFNRSFRWLFIQAACFLVQMAVTFLYFSYSYFTSPR
jgi:hypothetical protein